MPCYTRVSAIVKDKAMAEKALKAMGQEAEITKNSNGTYSVEPKSQRYGWNDSFMEEYSVQVATRQAKREGYTVTRKQEQGETGGQCVVLHRLFSFNEGGIVAKGSRDR